MIPILDCRNLRHGARMRALLYGLALVTACSSAPTMPVATSANQTAPDTAVTPVPAAFAPESLAIPIVIPTVIDTAVPAIPVIPVAAPVVPAPVAAPVAPAIPAATPVPAPAVPVPAPVYTGTPTAAPVLNAIYKLVYPLPSGIQPNGQAVRTLLVATNVGNTGFYGDVPVYCENGSCFAYWTMIGLITPDVEFVLTLAYKYNNGTYSPSGEKVVWHFIGGTTVMGPNRGSTPAGAPPVAPLVITQVRP